MFWCTSGFFFLDGLFKVNVFLLFNKTFIFDIKVDFFSKINVPLSSQLTKLNLNSLVIVGHPMYNFFFCSN